MVDHLEPLTKQSGKAQRGMQRNNSQQGQCDVKIYRWLGDGMIPIMWSTVSVMALYKYKLLSHLNGRVLQLSFHQFYLWKGQNAMALFLCGVECLEAVDYYLLSHFTQTL